DQGVEDMAQHRRRGNGIVVGRVERQRPLGNGGHDLAAARGRASGNRCQRRQAERRSEQAAAGGKKLPPAQSLCALRRVHASPPTIMAREPSADEVRLRPPRSPSRAMPPGCGPEGGPAGDVVSEGEQRSSQSPGGAAVITPPPRWEGRVGGLSEREVAEFLAAPWNGRLATVT